MENIKRVDTENNKPKSEKCTNFIEKPSRKKERDNEKKHDENLSPEEELNNLILRLKREFDPTDIQSCQNILLIIYNSIFLNEDSLTSKEKYQIFALLDIAITQIEQCIQEQKKCDIEEKNHPNSSREKYNEKISYLYSLAASPHIVPTFKLFKRGVTIE